MPLSKKIGALMERSMVSHEELAAFLRDHCTDLAIFAVKRSVDWLTFSQVMQGHVRHSYLGELLEKLDLIFSTNTLPFSQLLPRSVRQNIANFYPGSQHSNVDTLKKIHLLLMGDKHALKSLRKIKGVPISDLVSWMNTQKVPLVTLRLGLTELQYVLPMLEFVDFSGLHKEFIPFLFSMISQVSNLSCQWMNDEELSQLTLFSSLKSLDLTDAFLSDKGIESICKLTQLKSLNISGSSSSTDFLIQTLGRFKSLTELNISGFKEVSKLVHILPEALKLLDVSCCQIGESGLKIIGTFRNLKTLNLAGSIGIEDKHLENLGVLSHLENLDLSFLKIGDLGVMYLMDLEALKDLNMKGCRNITDRGVKNLCCQSLTSLGLKGCSLITDEAFKSLATLSKFLKRLDLSGCYKITDKGLYRIAEFPELTHLRLKGCNGVSNEGIFYLTRTKAKVSL